MIDPPRQSDLVIAETNTSMWNYHLRVVVDGKKYLTGGAPPALCGRKLGWDTKIPLRAWGNDNHAFASWCDTCATIAKTK